MSPVTEASRLATEIERRLACPTCHGPLGVDAVAIRCATTTCHFEGMVADEVVLVGDRSRVSFFADRHRVMEQGKACEGAWCLCYEAQVEVVEIGRASCRERV